MVAELWITGLPTPAKTRLIEALETRLASLPVLIRASQRDAPAPRGERGVVLHVHAQADADAFVEAHQSASSARSPDLVLATEWEAVGCGVQRVLDLLDRRGVLSEVERI
jgi:hypothetical protein